VSHVKRKKNLTWLKFSTGSTRHLGRPPQTDDRNLTETPLFFLLPHFADPSVSLHSCSRSFSTNSFQNSAHGLNTKPFRIVGSRRCCCCLNPKLISEEQRCVYKKKDYLLLVCCVFREVLMPWRRCSACARNLLVKRRQ
jgi:hypothetical protein